MLVQLEGTAQLWIWKREGPHLEPCRSQQEEFGSLRGTEKIEPIWDLYSLGQGLLCIVDVAGTGGLPIRWSSFLSAHDGNVRGDRGLVYSKACQDGPCVGALQLQPYGLESFRNKRKTCPRHHDFQHATILHDIIRVLYCLFADFNLWRDPQQIEESLDIRRSDHSNLNGTFMGSKHIKVLY